MTCRKQIDPKDERPQLRLPEDDPFAVQLQKFSEHIWKYQQHDSLLENNSKNTLSQEEIDAAWREFEADGKNGKSAKQ